MYVDPIRTDIHPATWAVVGVKKNPDGTAQISHRGTAFAVDGSGHLLTCWHVTYMDNDYKVDCDEFLVLQPELALNVRLKATLIAREKDRDIALLKIEGDNRTKAVRFFGGTAVWGRSCCAFGHALPLADAATQSIRLFTRAAAGVVSQRFQGSIFSDTRAVQLVELDFFTHPGSSGGAVFLNNGDVIGMVRGTLLVDDGTGKQVRSNLSMAVSIHEAVEFLKPLNVHPQIRGGTRR